MTAARRIVSMHTLMWLVVLVISQLNKTIPLIHRDNSLRKVNLTFKRGFIVLKLANISVVNQLSLDSVLAIET